MNIPIRQLKKWIAALDSGEYNGWPWVEFLEIQWPIDFSDVAEIERDFAARTSVPLSHLYDDLGWSFPEIATLLELVYVHKILD